MFTGKCSSTDFTFDDVSTSPLSPEANLCTSFSFYKYSWYTDFHLYILHVLRPSIFTHRRWVKRSAKLPFKVYLGCVFLDSVSKKLLWICSCRTGDLNRRILIYGLLYWNHRMYISVLIKPVYGFNDTGKPCMLVFFSSPLISTPDWRCGDLHSLILSQKVISKIE